jgi:putative heme-binding domain-containing protein
MLQHAARFLPENRVDDLATLVRGKFGDDIDFQWALYKPILDGLAQRGIAPSAKIKSWGGTLAKGILDSLSHNKSDWMAVPLDAHPDSANPWVVQNRKCADGATADFFSSLAQPGGNHEKLTGVMRSKPFAAPAQLSFWIAGHDGYPKTPAKKVNLVRLRDAETREVLASAPAPRNDTAKKVTWNVSHHAGKRVFLELVDGDTGDAYAWIAAGRFEPPIFSLPKITPKLVEERLHAAASIAQATRDASLEAPLAEALKTPAGLDARGSVAVALLALNAKQHVGAAADLLNDPGASTALRQKLAQALSDANLDEARAALLAVVRTAPERNQSKLAAPLATNKAGAEALLRDIEQGKLSARLLQDRTVKEKLLAAKVPNADTRIEKLTKNLSPLNVELQKQIDQRRAAFAKANGSASRGQAVFEKTCAICHQLDGKGALVGPQLDGVGARGAERIIEDVVDPNRNVDSAFRATNFVLDDGDVVSGLFRREEGEQIVYADGTGKEQTITKQRVKQRKPSELSLMPEGLPDGLQPQEFNDLIAFLLTKNGAKK